MQPGGEGAEPFLTLHSKKQNDMRDERKKLVKKVYHVTDGQRYLDRFESRWGLAWFILNYDFRHYLRIYTTEEFR